MDIFNRKNISLALDSGSSKGIAHIGVIEELEASGYNISAIAGTSMGAIVAAYYSTGKMDILKDWLFSLDKKTSLQKLDFSLSGGVIGGDKILHEMQNHFADMEFKDAKIPLYVVATNIDSGEEEVFSEGPIASALRASISIPGAFKPFLYNGSYYVDGAVSNPLPIDVLFKNKHKNIVAVHLHKYISMRDYSKAPSILEVADRSMSIVSRYLAQANMRDAICVIEPDLKDFDMIHFLKAREIIEIGSEATRQAISSGALSNMASRAIHKIKNRLSKRLEVKP